MIKSRPSWNQALKECQVFSALDDVALESVASSLIDKQYEAGTTIFHEGDKASELLVIREGKVALQMALPKSYATAQRRITVDVVAKNDVAGWSAIVEPHIYTLTAVCLQETKALSISSNKLNWLLQSNYDIGYAVLRELIKVVASRLHETRQVLLSERMLLPGP